MSLELVDGSKATSWRRELVPPQSPASMCCDVVVSMCWGCSVVVLAMLLCVVGVSMLVMRTRLTPDSVP